MWQDIRYALRTLRRTPGFTAIAIVSLTLGIGANTAIFSLVNILILRQLPVRNPQQLVELLRRYPGEPRLNAFALDDYAYFRDHNHVFSDLIGAAPRTLALGSEAVPERVTGEYVTGNFFSALGLKPALGRLISTQDEGSVVVSWSYYSRHFHLDPAVLGKQLIVDNVPFTVAGVAPRDFEGWQPGAPRDLWLPAGPNRAKLSLQLVGRLKPGATIQRARAEMLVLNRQIIDFKINNSPFVREMQMEVAPAGAGLSFLRDQFGQPLMLLTAVVGLLLLIACTNVASMLLARGAARQREMKVRIALGAGRLRLTRQVLTESLTLSIAGSLLGILVAWYGANALVRIVTSDVRRGRFDLHAAPDTHVLLFAAAVAILTGILFGLAPALHALGAAPATAMREAAHSGETRSRRLLGKSLVAAQVALSVAMLCGAGMFIRLLSNLYADLGFQRDHVLLVTLGSSHSNYDPERLSRAYEQLLARLQSIPGVHTATLSAMTPISGAGANRNINVEGYRPNPAERRFVMENWVAPKYFETLGMPLLAGRDFNFEDRGRPRIAIVNRTMARYYFGASNPIGKHVTFDQDDKPYEIVGVVGDAKYQEVREVTPRTIYFHAFQEARAYSQLGLRTNISPTAVAPEVRRAVRESLNTVSVARIATLADQVDASIVPERLVATLSSWFGILGAALAALGVYGLLAYTVARRVNEIGIRMAIGARPNQVTRMILADALGMLCAGLALGVLLALWGRAFAASIIQDVPVNGDAPIVFGAVAMLAVGLLAAYAPARRAAQIDPMEALRRE